MATPIDAEGLDPILDRPDPEQNRPASTPAPVPAPLDPVPAPPSFGWIGDTDLLTGDELDDIAQYTGMPFSELDMYRLRALCAVTLARRENPRAYPYEIAGRIPIGRIRAHAPGGEGPGEA